MVAYLKKEADQLTGLVAKSAAAMSENMWAGAIKADPQMLDLGVGSNSSMISRPNVWSSFFRSLPATDP